MFPSLALRLQGTIKPKCTDVGISTCGWVDRWIEVSICISMSICLYIHQEVLIEEEIAAKLDKKSLVPYSNLPDSSLSDYCES